MDRLVGEMPTDENGKGVGFSESIGGYDFRAWEKFDVDKALEEMDKDEVMSDDEKKRKLATARNTQKEREAHRKMRLARDRENLSSDFLEALDAMSKEEREFMATRERQKGNECFKAGELDEAVVNYTRSAALNPFNAPVHANRSLAYLRLKMFERAEDDCTHALEVDPKYVKAWSRRGMVRHRRGKYAGAMTDFETALELEPSNVEVSKLLSKSKAKFEELEGIDNKAGTSFTRVTIEEVDSDNDDDDEGGDDESGGGQGFRKISIVMDDDSDSDEESDGDEDQAPAKSEFTKVQIVCDDDESDDSGDEAEKKYTTVSIVDVDGDEDDDESDDDDDVEQVLVSTICYSPFYSFFFTCVDLLFQCPLLSRRALNLSKSKLNAMSLMTTMVTTTTANLSSLLKFKLNVTNPTTTMMTTTPPNK
jgi:tetratricopeptide (TPR) repeat protein